MLVLDSEFGERLLDALNGGKAGLTVEVMPLWRNEVANLNPTVEGFGVPMLTFGFVRKPPNMTLSSAALNAPFQPLVKRIHDEATIAANDIIKIDHFLNHRIEPAS